MIKLANKLKKGFLIHIIKLQKNKYDVGRGT